MRGKHIILALLLALLLSSCGTVERNVRPDSDSGLAFEAGARIPQDRTIYEIQGVVYEDAESLVRQTAPAQATMYYQGAYGYGSYWGPQLGGKGLVRLAVIHTDPPTGLALPGTAVILKTTDTKATNLRPGDIVTFKCRAQYEAVAATLKNENFDPDTYETWELDYCRLANPTIGYMPLEDLDDGRTNND